MSKVYVLILNWNGWRDTLNCLESVFANTYSSYKVVVCDNGSTDNSLEHIKAWAEESFPGEDSAGCSKALPYVVFDRLSAEGGDFSSDINFPLTLIDNGENLGFGAGNNVGIRYLKSQNDWSYLWILNNDTKTDPDAMYQLVDEIQNNEELGAVGSVLHYMDNPDKIQAWGGGWVSYLTGRCGHYAAPTATNKIHYLTAASVLLRREALNQVGGFDERYFMYWEDTDLAFRLMQRGWKLGVAEKSKVFHKESATLGKKSVALEEYFNFSSVIFFKTHAKMPVLPISIGTAGRVLKRIILGDLARAGAVWRGAKKGCAASNKL